MAIYIGTSGKSNKLDKKKKEEGPQGAGEEETMMRSSGNITCSGDEYTW